MNVLVTGGAGFIGSALCLRLVASRQHRVVNLDRLTYAASPRSLDALADQPRYRFVRGDIADEALVLDLLAEERIDIVLHLAAETHADRSIDGPAAFVGTNVVGTFHLLEAARRHWTSLPDAAKARFRFHHVSTDEVYGDLPLDGGAFAEGAAYAPSSPYSASKAASDHLAMAWHRTYGLPVVLSHGSNTYGPRQFPEKLIPLTILKALEGKAIPLYGSGLNVRDWIHVEDHARALETIALTGRIGCAYNVGGGNERTNLQVAHLICDSLDRLSPRSGAGRRRELIAFVPDRPGHDLRYAVDTTRLRSELGWRAREDFETGLEATVRWFLDNEDWWARIRTGSYDGTRLGLGSGSGA